MSLFIGVEKKTWLVSHLMCQTSAHLQMNLSWMTGTSNISCPIATYYNFLQYAYPGRGGDTGTVKSSPKHLEIKVAGEKGRGLFATGDIRRNSFICKYKVSKSRPPFTRNQRPAVEQEYKVVRDVTSSRRKMWKGDGVLTRPVI